VFGNCITNSDGKKIPVRLIGEQHVREDCGGRIPSVEDWVEHISPKAWMSRGYNIHEERVLTHSDDDTYEGSIK
jgi:hypothetical protein